MELEKYLQSAKDEMKKVVEVYQNNLIKISVGRANPKIFEQIKVLYYGHLTPMNQVASISIPQSQQVLIKPFDQSILKEVVLAINNAHLGLSANNEGHQVRINIPQLTTQRRQELVKQIVVYTEQARISIRSIRQKINKNIKNDLDLSEDQTKDYLEETQKLTDKYINQIEEITKQKEVELMTI